MTSTTSDILLSLDAILANINHFLYQFWFDVQDPRTRHLPFIDVSPLVPLVFMYYFHRSVTKTIPNYMSDREPYKLRKVIRYYDLCMAAINAIAFYEVSKRMDFGRVLLNFVYNREDRINEEIQIEIVFWYLYVISKMLDLFDTVFFALKKKYTHITFLHLYHHISVPLMGWLILKMNYDVPGLKLFTFMNSFIHVIMYSYYYLSSFGPRFKKYLWWKKYLTQMQIGQFAVLSFYTVMIALKQQGYPKVYLTLIAPQSFFFFYMFIDFYKKSYEKQEKKTE